MRSIVSIFFVFFCVCSHVHAAGLTPASPEVQASVRRAVAYLNAQGKREIRIGGKALIGLALIKSGAENDHPVIIDAVNAVRRLAHGEKITSNFPVYDIGISAMFLAELDPVEFAPELSKLSDKIAHTQQRPVGTEGGGWGYLASGDPVHTRGGDMSMTQYAVMGAWSIHRNGGYISEKMIQTSARWLLYVQMEDGGYAYTSRLTQNGQVDRDVVRVSTTAAGMATVYVMRDLLGLNPKKTSGNEKEFIPPKAFKLVENDDVSTYGKSFKSTISKSSFKTVQDRGNYRVEQNLRNLDANIQYFYYYLYALERYYGFKEIADNRYETSPNWYNLVASHLVNTQQSDGSWKSDPGTGGCGQQVDTAYAVLVLLRSTKLSLEKGPTRFDGGNMQGGRGMPKTTDQLTVKDGQIVSLTEMGNVDSLMERLENLGELDEQTLSRLAKASNYELGPAFLRNSSQVRRLVGSGTPEMRKATVEMLGRTGDVHQVPALIYALTDPDHDVAVAAQAALMSVSRNPQGKNLPDSTAADYERVRKEYVDFWKDWYKKIDSTAIFD